MRYVVLLGWWFVVSYAGSAGWLVMAPPTGPFATKELCDGIANKIIPDPRFIHVKVSECWDGGPVQIQTVPVYQ